MKQIVIFLVCALHLAALAQGFRPNYCGPIPYQTVTPTFSPKSNANLMQVQLLIRHGDRTNASPGVCWVGDTAVWNCTLHSTCIPSQDGDLSQQVSRVYRELYLPGREDFPGNCKTGQLTDYGYGQEVTNGQFFRSLYVEKLKFLPDSYDPTQVFLRSDDYQRTMQSLQAFTNGLFPADNNSDTTQMIDFHTMDLTYDDIQPNAVLCPMFGVLETLGYNSSDYLAREEADRPLFEKLSQYTGLNITSLDQLSVLYDCLNTHVCSNKTLPEWFSEDLYYEVETEAVWQTNYLLSYPTPVETGRLGIGFLIKEMFEQMEAVVNNTETYKFLLYSGHDYSIMPFLVALGLNDSIWAHYASWVDLELWSDHGTEDYSVRIIYNNEVQVLPGCSEFCYWSDFVTLLSPLLPNASDCYSPDVLLRVLGY